MRWMKCKEMAKSGTSFDREIRSSIAITLYEMISVQFPYLIDPESTGRASRDRKGALYPMNELSSQTNPNIHPTVVSPLRLLQLNTISNENLLPATRAVKRISVVATPYQIVCKSKIWVRILRGGSSVKAPGRGGRRRRAILSE